MRATTWFVRLVLAADAATILALLANAAHGLAWMRDGVSAAEPWAYGMALLALLVALAMWLFWHASHAGRWLHVAMAAILLVPGGWLVTPWHVAQPTGLAGQATLAWQASPLAGTAWAAWGLVLAVGMLTPAVRHRSDASPARAWTAAGTGSPPL